MIAKSDQVDAETSFAHSEVLCDRYNANMELSRSSRRLPAALSVAVIVAEQRRPCRRKTPVGALSVMGAPVWPDQYAHCAEVRHLIRKTGHFVGYGGVSVAFLYGWLGRYTAGAAGNRPIWLHATFLAVSCSLLIAILDDPYFRRSFSTTTTLEALWPRL